MSDRKEASLPASRLDPSADRLGLPSRHAREE
jgi:hypothetical protein